MSDKGIFYEGVLKTAIQAAQGGTTPPALTVSPDRQYYNTMVNIMETGTWVDSECAEIAFLNVGDGNFPNPVGANAVILGFVIKPGFGISFDGNENEIDMTKYQVNFQGGGAQNCWVFRKMYR